VAVRRNKQRGFTLIELLTILFIISVLAAIAIPHLRRAVVKADVVGCKSNLRNIAAAITVYSNDNNHLFPDQLYRLTPSYVQSIPCCPGVSANTYSAGYETNTDYNIYTIYCKGKNHSDYGYTVDEPYYTSSDGLFPKD